MKLVFIAKFGVSNAGTHTHPSSVDRGRYSVEVGHAAIITRVGGGTRRPIRWRHALLGARESPSGRADMVTRIVRMRGLSRRVLERIARWRFVHVR